MNRIAGIICELNPLHYGHIHLIEEARCSGVKTVILVMSGNFVQRGECAIADKYTRAEAAVRCGADLVLELPFPYSSGSAGYFAVAGVNILDRLGIVDELWFGSECGYIEELKMIAQNELSARFQKKVAELYGGETGFASAQTAAYEGLFGKTDVLYSPNGTLAVEYIKALIMRKSIIKPITVKRLGDYSSVKIDSGFPSASAVRRLVYEGRIDEVRKTMPDAAFSVFERAACEGLAPAKPSNLDTAKLMYFRLASATYLKKCDGVSGGLENKIIAAAREASTYKEFFEALPTKQYTASRLSRTLIDCLMGVEERDLKAPPEYTVLLAASGKGRKLLSSVRRTSGIQIVTKPADADSISDAAKRQAELSDRVDALYTLCLPTKKDASYFRRKSPYIG